LVVAIHASADGEANDAPLAPRLVDQCQAEFAGPVLYVADRQFCDLKIPRRIDELGQSFLIRYSKKMLFSAENERVFSDAEGRVVREAWGWLGSAKDPRRMYLRQITLTRSGEEDIVLVTNLLSGEEVPGEALLQAYLARWTIERVFQQVTEVFHLERLVSTSPQGAIFQFALCVLLYNLIQAIRGYIAALQSRPARTLSSEMIFRSACDQLTACATLLPTEPLVTHLARLPTPGEVRERLTCLLANQWSALWIKSPTKKKSPPTPQRTIPGGHSSAWKLILASKPKPPPR
jgi:Transposase DDE domain